MPTKISKTELARRSRQIVDLARRGHTIIVESYGAAQVAIMDILDYRLLRAVAAYRAAAPRPAPVRDETIPPRGLDEEEVKQVVRDAGGEEQAGWDRVLAAYLDGDISFGRTAQLLDLSRFELVERFNRLGISLQLGSTT